MMNSVDTVPLLETDEIEIANILNCIKKSGKSVVIRQFYPGGNSIKAYKYKTGFPHGVRGKSVTGWYSVNFKEDRLWMSSKEMVTYIFNVNNGRGGAGISYNITVE